MNPKAGPFFGPRGMIWIRQIREIYIPQQKIIPFLLPLNLSDHNKSL